MKHFGASHESNKPAYRYQVGGTMDPDEQSYVYRQADEDIYRSLKSGKFVYVFNSRQMGKSSLMAKTMKRLLAEKICCIAVDLTKVGTQSTRDWYVSIITLLHKYPLLKLSSQLDLESWFSNHQMLPPVPLFDRYLQEVLLGQIKDQHIILFFDEIDLALKLGKDTSDFFALIRSCFNQRATDADYKRLTFALFGVATPDGLMQDKTNTPFNIGQGIALEGFEFDRSQVLVDGLVGWVPDPSAMLKEILGWTGGQPFLTQKLCDLVQRTIEKAEQSLVSEGQEATWLKQLVQSEIIENWKSQDIPEHLSTIHDRILSNPNRVGRSLELYQQIIKGDGIEADSSDDQNELCLAGLVVRRQGRLEVYNRIYAAVFSEDWVKQKLASLDRPYASKLRAWHASGKQDEQHLLQGQELDEYSDWAEGKYLSDTDYRFLEASHQFVLQEVQTVLDINTKESNRLQDQLENLEKDLSKTKSQLEQTNKNLQRNKVIGQRALISSFIFSIFIIFAGFTLNKKNISEASHGIGFLARQHNFYLIATIANEFAISINPEFPPAYYELGYTYSEMGRDDKAFPFLDVAVSKFKDKNAYASYSRLLVRRRDYIEAEKFILKALKEDEISQYYHYSQLARLYQYLGWAQSEQQNAKKSKEAESNLLKSIDLDKQYATPYCLLAKISQKAKNRPQELKYWQSCLKFANSQYLDQKMWIEIAQKRIQDSKN